MVGLVSPHPSAVGSSRDGGETSPTPPVFRGHPLGWGMLSGSNTLLLPRWGEYPGGSTHGCREMMTEQSPQPCTAPRLSPEGLQGSEALR